MIQCPRLRRRCRIASSSVVESVTLFDGRVECSGIGIASSNAASFPGGGDRDRGARSGGTISQRAHSGNPPHHLTAAQFYNLRKYWSIIFCASADDHERRCRQVDMRTCRVHTMRQLGSKETRKRSMTANLYEEVPR